MNSLKQALCLILSFVVPTLAWADPVLVGTIQTCTDTAARGAAVTHGESVFSEDEIIVGSRGSARIVLGGGTELQLLSNTRVRIVKSGQEDLFRLDLLGGAVRFSSPEEARIEVHVAGNVVRPVDRSSAMGFISAMRPDTVIVGAERGSLVVDSDEHGGGRIIVREGSVRNVAPSSAQASPQRTTREGHHHGALIVLVGAIIVGGVVGAAVAANMAEPSQNKGAAVSPFKP
jgi:FecR-like protein